MRAHLRVLLVCAAVLLSSGCRLAKDFLPRTHTAAVAPDGQTRAFVRQHLNSDPPDDHLYLARPGERAQEVMALAPDADGCRTIVWSPDSRKVGFVINDRRLAVYDAGSFELEAMLLLTEPDSQEVRSVSLGKDGTVSFDIVERALLDVPQKGGRRLQVPAVRDVQYRPGTRVRAPERLLGRQTVSIPPQRLSFRVRSANGAPAGKRGWARVRSRNGHMLQVPWASDSDSIVRLPAFNLGRLAVVEISANGYRRREVLKDVEMTDAPIEVTLPPE